MGRRKQTIIENLKKRQSRSKHKFTINAEIRRILYLYWFIANSIETEQRRFNNVSIKLPTLTGRSLKDGFADDSVKM